MAKSRNKMKKWVYVYLLFMMVSQTFSSEKEFKGGIVNGQAVGRCVAGFCLPAKYSNLDPPTIDDVNQIEIETNIMDVLMVRLFVIYYNIYLTVALRKIYTLSIKF